jgi:OOP family OmpA-OmpF porin
MKYLICLAMSLAFVQAAGAQDRGGAYMGFSLGSFSYADDEDLLDDSASAYRIMGGYRFNDHFALEGGWEKTGDLEETFSEDIPPLGTLTLNLAADFEILTVKALAFLPFEKASLLGGVGYYDAEAGITATATGFGGAGQASDEAGEDGAMLVAGVEFNLERIDIRAELEWFDVDDAEASGINVGVLFHF